MDSKQLVFVPFVIELLRWSFLVSCTYTRDAMTSFGNEISTPDRCTDQKNVEKKRIFNMARGEERRPFVERQNIQRSTHDR